MCCVFPGLLCVDVDAVYIVVELGRRWKCSKLGQNELKFDCPNHPLICPFCLKLTTNSDSLPILVYYNLIADSYDGFDLDLSAKERKKESSKKNISQLLDPILTEIDS